MSSKNNVSAQKILALGNRIMREWDAHPELFAGYKISKAEFSALLKTTTEASNAVKNNRRGKRAEVKRLRAERESQIKQARTDFTTGVKTLDRNLEVNVKTEKQALTELSRFAKGARFFAKSRTFSDEDSSNDAWGKTL